VIVIVVVVVVVMVIVIVIGIVERAILHPDVICTMSCHTDMFAYHILFVSYSVCHTVLPL